MVDEARYAVTAFPDGLLGRGAASSDSSLPNAVVRVARPGQVTLDFPWSIVTFKDQMYQFSILTNELTYKHEQFLIVVTSSVIMPINVIMSSASILLIHR
jgi:hypothetical protein